MMRHFFLDYVCIGDSIVGELVRVRWMGEVTSKQARQTDLLHLSFHLHLHIFSHPSPFTPTTPQISKPTNFVRSAKDIPQPSSAQLSFYQLDKYLLYCTYVGGRFTEKSQAFLLPSGDKLPCREGRARVYLPLYFTTGLVLATDGQAHTTPI